MPQAFYMYSLREFPREERFGTEQQLYLQVDHQSNIENVQTTIQRSQRDFRPGVDRLEIEHDFLKRLRYPGRARNMEFAEYVCPYRFPAFIEREDTGHEATLIVRTKAEVAADFLKRMQTVDHFRASERRLDFGLLKPELRFIKGAWFAEMRSANLAAAGMFGPHVDRSDEFLRAERHGTLRSLTLCYTFRERDYHTMITANGGVVLYDSFDAETEEIDVVMGIKRQLLDRCWAM